MDTLAEKKLKRKLRRARRQLRAVTAPAVGEPVVIQVEHNGYRYTGKFYPEHVEQAHIGVYESMMRRVTPGMHDRILAN